jgi:hypothetical protein
MGLLQCQEHKVDLITVLVPALKPLQKCGNCGVGGGKEKENESTIQNESIDQFAFALFAKSTC